MCGSGWGRIVNISSTASYTGGITAPLYVASPTGLRGLLHSYAAQIDDLRRYSKDGCAGLIETDMVRHIEAKPGLIPIGRFGGAEEIADTVLMLARNSYITGQTTNVNGGLYFS